MSNYVTRGRGGALPSVLRLGPGRGRDFVVGDIHGCFSLVENALKQLRFDPAVDRLICCGDLVDRGEQSLAADDFLKRPGVYSVRGNHEQMLLDGYENGFNQLAAWHSQDNGGRWFLQLSEQQQSSHLAAYRAMPLAIELPTAQGLIGIVHAEVPVHMNWGQFVQALEYQDPEACDSALWGRLRLKYGVIDGVPGVWRVFSGHTVRHRLPQWLGNVCFLDTGAYAGLKSGTDVGLGLTVANVLAIPQENMEPRRSPFLNLFDV